MRLLLALFWAALAAGIAGFPEIAAWLMIGPIVIVLLLNPLAVLIGIVFGALGAAKKDRKDC